MAFLLQLPSPLSTSRHHPLPVFTSLTKASLSHKITQTQNSIQLSKWVPNFQSKSLNFLLSGSLALALSFTGVGFAEGKVGVNKPELLPKEFTSVIDVAGFLSDGQVWYTSFYVLITMGDNVHVWFCKLTFNLLSVKLDFHNTYFTNKTHFSKYAGGGTHDLGPPLL
ncbi:Hypothetical predicted protein, partial [Olea europaea subsp. europaea]